MKRFLLSILLALTLIVSLSACGEAPAIQSSTDTPADSSPVSPEPAEPDTVQPVIPVSRKQITNPTKMMEKPDLILFIYNGR